jgi:hypothetical protein
MFEEELAPKKGFRLLNAAKAMSKEHLPGRKEREGLEVGDFVELTASVDSDAMGVSEISERLWVEVIGVGAKKYEGFVRTAPDYRELQETLKWGDLVEFKPIHVMSIKRNQK